MVIDGTAGDPYRALLRANETDVRLVMVNGTPRLGMPRLMGTLGAKGERVTIGGEPRVLHTAQASADPVVGQINLADAMTTLRTTLGGLGGIGADPDAPRMAEFDAEEPRWFLARDELAPSGMEVRHRLEFAGEETGPPINLDRGARLPSYPSCSTR